MGIGQSTNMYIATSLFMIRQRIRVADYEVRENNGRTMLTKPSKYLV